MCWLMVLPGGRWYSHWRVEDGVADVITTGADVIALGQYLF